MYVFFRLSRKKKEIFLREAIKEQIKNNQESAENKKEIIKKQSFSFSKTPVNCIRVKPVV